MREMHVPTYIVSKADVPKRIVNFEATEEELIDWYMRGVLERTHGNQSEAQRILEIARTTVRRRMAQLGISSASRKAARKPLPKRRRRRP
jgi:DNA-binding NtrC family response regulator